MDLTSLISWWKLEEASGNRADAHGSNTLSAVNNPGNAAGIQGNAVQLVAASSQLLSIASNASLETGDIDYTVAGWVYLDSTGADRVVLSKYNSGSVREYRLIFINSSSRFQWNVYDAATSQIGVVNANTFGAPSTATWYFIRCWHDAANNQVGIQVNATAADTAATSGAAGATAATLRMGDWIGTGISPWNGRLDEWSFWKRMLTADEHTYLYNGGAGRTYPP